MSISFICDETGNIPTGYKQKSSENASTFTAFFFCALVMGKRRLIIVLNFLSLSLWFPFRCHSAWNKLTRPAS